MTYNRNHVLALYRRLFPLHRPSLREPRRRKGWNWYLPKGGWELFGTDKGAPKFHAASLAGLMATMRLLTGLSCRVALATGRLERCPHRTGERAGREYDYGNPPVFTEQDAQDHEREKAIRGDR